MGSRRPGNAVLSRLKFRDSSCVDWAKWGDGFMMPLDRDQSFDDQLLHARNDDIITLSSLNCEYPIAKPRTPYAVTRDSKAFRFRASGGRARDTPLATNSLIREATSGSPNASAGGAKR